MIRIETFERLALLEEVDEQDFSGVAGACSTNTFTLSTKLGNNGWFCTITKECTKYCQ